MEKSNLYLINNFFDHLRMCQYRIQILYPLQTPWMVEERKLHRYMDVTN